MLISLVEITGADAAGTLTTFRFSTGTGYRHPSAPGPYAPRLVQPCAIHRAMLGLGTTSGGSAEDFGECVLVNLDGGIDALKGYGFAGHSFRWLLVDDQAAYGTAVVALACILGPPKWSWSEARFTLRSRRSSLSNPARLGTYAGTGGLEGGTALVGQVRQRVYGRCLRVPCIMVDTALFIGQVHDGAAKDLTSLYLGGVPLTRGADYPDQATLQATAPAAGQYRFWPGGGYFRLAAAPTGTLYADLDGDYPGGVWASTTADLIKRVAKDLGGLVDADFVTADLTSLNAVAPGICGVVVRDNRAPAEVLDQLAAGAGCWWGFDAAGRFRIGRLAVPASPPVAGFTRVTLGNPAGATVGDIIEIDVDTANDANDGVPPWRVEVNYARAYTTASFSEGASGASTDERNFVASEWRTAAAEDATVKLKHQDAGIFQKDSCFVLKADADAEAARELALRKGGLDNLVLTVRFGAELAAVLDLGAAVTVRLPRYGYDAGRTLLVREIEPDAGRMVAKLWLWG